MSGRRAVVAVALGLALLAAHHMRQALFEGRVYFERDIHIEWHAQMESFVRAVAEGAPPLWDPWIGFGQPMLANPNNQLLYPLTWLNLLMVPPSYYKLYLFVHVVGGGLGASLVARRLGASWAAAFVAGAGYMLSGSFLSLANAWNHLAGAAWLPWLILVTDRFVEAPYARRALALSLPPAAMVLAGSPDYLLLGGPAALGMGAWRWRRTGAPARSVLGAAAAAAALAIALSAAQWVPSLELARRSERAAMSPGEGFWSLHPVAAIQVVVPVDLAEAPVPAGWKHVLFEGREPYLFSIYSGVPLLLLGLAGLAARRSFPRGVMLCVMLLMLLASFGRHAPVHGWLVTLLPPLGALRFPVKAITVAALLLALAAGQGADVLAGAGARGRRLVAGAAIAVAALSLAVRSALEPSFFFLGRPLAHVAVLGIGAAAVLLAPTRGLVTLAGLGALAIGDLAWSHRGLNPTAPADFYRDRPALVADVAPADMGRWLVFDYTNRPDAGWQFLRRQTPYVVRATQDSATPQFWQAAMGTRLYPVAPLLASWRVFGSYSRDLLGLLPPPLVRMNDALYGFFPGPAFELILRVGGVTHFAALHDVDTKALRLERRLRGPYFEDIRLYRVEQALPRAYVVTEARGGTLLDPDYDPTRQVLLEEAGPPVRGGDAPHLVPARIVEYRSDRVRIEAESTAGGYLVLVDAWDPGWRASVDGREAPVHRANAGFRAVAISSGRQVVEMRYRPVSVPLGLALSAAGVLAAGLAWRSGPEDLAEA